MWRKVHVDVACPGYMVPDRQPHWPGPRIDAHGEYPQIDQSVDIRIVSWDGPVPPVVLGRSADEIGRIESIGRTFAVQELGDLLACLRPRALDATFHRTPDMRSEQQVRRVPKRVIGR